MPNHRPWMPLYVAEYLADTRDLSTEDHGAYLLLIMHYWQTGPLPSDPKILARLSGLSRYKFEKNCANFLQFFVEEGGKYFHKRIDREIAKAADISGKRAEAGRAGGVANAAANAKQLPTQSHTHIKATNKKERTPLGYKKERTPLGSQRKVGTRLPKNFEPPSDWLAWAGKKYPEVDAADQFDRFRDYWVAKPGQGATKLDWRMTWQNWVRRANDDQIRWSNRSKRTESAADRTRRIADERARARGDAGRAVGANV